ncbi:hypothetical protein LsR_01902 (plasmid) [Ligilactobacillus salivarius str. Ren]|uniref:Uncharacterized protein n=1 Tax=Ligilactobacillus salivarius str. Ren TaxID=1194971 RepID=A0A0F7PWK7_9LACO|nr:hypothetical protein LsR_01902 [Ligilactobacillus salivarius str. Ren]
MLWGTAPKLSSCTASGSKKTGKPLSSSVKNSSACLLNPDFGLQFQLVKNWLWKSPTFEYLYRIY